MKNIEVLAFDAFGTLFDVHSVIEACEEVYPGSGESLSQIWRAKQLEYSWLLSLMERYEPFATVTRRALSYACKSLGLSFDDKAEERLIGAYLHLKPYADVKPALDSLSGYTRVILSNGDSQMLRSVMDNSGLGGSLDDVLSVEDVEIFKPSPRAYEVVTANFGLDASSVGYVSSNSFDVAGAKSFGFQTFWVNRRNDHLDELGLTPDLTVRSLSELAEHLT